ncbi:hypothetical protein ACFYT4_24980 [Streptomyces sp. NPDC004609]|uniref:hypothetical protein n=1 Tax=Streptomyces sp. NPDC004609 TaxID=3364704 RepID=UPI0036A9E918
MTGAETYLDITNKKARRRPDAKGSLVLPRTWAIERSWSWSMKGRLLCRNQERLPGMNELLITWAAITTVMTRRPARRTARPAERRGITTEYPARVA